MKQETTEVLRRFVADCEAAGKDEFVFSDIKGLKKLTAEWRIREVYKLRPLRSVPLWGTNLRHFWSVAELKAKLESEQ